MAAIRFKTHLSRIWEVERGHARRLLWIALIAVLAGFGNTSHAAPPAKKAGAGQQKAVSARLAKDQDIEGSLARELALQGLLIAAEDELGLITTDSSIGESVSDEITVPPLTVTTVVRPKKDSEAGGSDAAESKMEIRISRSDFFQWTSPAFTIKGNSLIEPLTADVETLSRGPFVDALKQAGFERNTTKPKDKIQDRGDDHLDFVCQFARIQRLKRMLREKESPELLGDLIRAYANLGSLTDFHWNIAPKAYQARSLLYAERLITKYKATPFSLAHRAYALALAGRHASALEAVKEAKNAKGTKAPNWLGLIDAYCQYEPQPLKKQTGELRPLALYLRIRMSDEGFCNEDPVQICAEFLAINAANVRVADFLASGGEFRMVRQVTESVFGQSWPVVYRRIAKVPGLPGPAKQIADMISEKRLAGTEEYEQRAKLMSILTSEVKDQPGPSLAALADLIREVSFSQAWHTLDCQHNLLGVDTEPALSEFEPLCQGHRFAKYLRIFAPDDQGHLDSKLSTEIVKSPSDFGAWKLVVGWSRRTENRTIREHVGKLVIANADPVYPDLVQLIAVPYWAEMYPKHRQQLIEISPYWPGSIVDAINRDLDVPIDEMERKYESYPSVQSAIKSRYLGLNRPKDAIRCAKRIVELIGTCRAYQDLAELYRSLDDEEAWFATMKQGLKVSDGGLEHAQIHSDLAKWLLDRGRIEEAGPHAKEAADSFSAWGLGIGARWAESARDWKAAETYVSNLSHRYAGSEAEYYLWCIRTGRGNRKSARVLAEGYWNSLPIQQRDSVAANVGVSLVADGNRTKASEFWHEMYLSAPYTAGVYAALLDDADGNTESRDRLLEEISFHAAVEPTQRELVNAFRLMLSGKAAKWNRNSMEMIVAKSSPYALPTIYMLAGKFLVQHDNKDLGVEYLQCAATSEQLNSWSAVAAGHELKKLNVDVGIPRSALATEELDRKKRVIDRCDRDGFLGETEKCRSALKNLLKTDPEFLPGYVASAMFHERQENYSQAISDLKQALKLDPDFYYAHVQLARILSTCELAEFRDGKKALEHAESAARLRGFETTVSVSALASAYAECGQFEKAVELETRAQALPDYEKALDERLKQYSAGKPYHAKPNIELLKPVVPPLIWRWN